MIAITKPLKIENISTGGDTTDYLPTEVTTNIDYIAAKGFSLEASQTEKLDLSPDTNVTCLSFASVILTKNFIPDDLKTYKVSSSFQYLNFEFLTIDGTIQVDGDVVIFN